MNEQRSEYGRPAYRPPTGEEIRALLRVWNLTGAAAGDMVGVGARQMGRYTGDEQDLPYAVLFALAAKVEGTHVSPWGWRAELASAIEAGRKVEPVSSRTS